MLVAQEPRVLAIIPARFASTRLPGKMIATLAGKPLVLHTYERACLSTLVTETIIAADDQRILDALAPYGAKAVLTDPAHQTGTDRIAEVAAKQDADIIVNVQGDEPLIDPHTIDAAIQPMLEDPALAMATARHPITARERIQDPNVVKVVCDQHGRALYFSRAPIPVVRDGADQETSEIIHWQHIGLYVYRRNFLLEFAQLPQTPLEKLEKLEQLRALENGHSIAVVNTEYEAVGVDSPEDLERVAAIFNAKKQEG